MSRSIQIGGVSYVVRGQSTENIPVWHRLDVVFHWFNQPPAPVF